MLSVASLVAWNSYVLPEHIKLNIYLRFEDLAGAGKTKLVFVHPMSGFDLAQLICMPQVVGG